MSGAPFVFLSAEVILFAGAALVHAGLFGAAFAHRQASTAEAVIAAILVVGLVAALVSRRRAALAAIAAQTLALLGTLLGAVMIAIGVGPQTLGDLVLHAVMILLLGTGLWQSRRWAGEAPPT